MQNGSSSFWEKEYKSLVAFKDKAIVLCISNEIKSRLYQKEKIFKPEPVNIYNLTMKGVD